MSDEDTMDSALTPALRDWFQDFQHSIPEQTDRLCYRVKKEPEAPVIPPPPFQSDEEILTDSEICDRLKLAPKQATDEQKTKIVNELRRKRGRRKPIPCIKVGKFRRFRFTEVLQWAHQNANSTS